MPIGAGNDATQDDESDLSEDDFTNMRAGTDEGGISLGHLSIQGDSSGSSAADGSSQSGQNMQTQPAWTAMRGRGFMGGALSNPSASDANQGSFNSSAYGEPSRCTAGAGSTAGKSQASNAPRSKGFAKIKAHKPVVCPNSG